MLVLIPVVYFFFHIRAIFWVFLPVQYWSFYGTLKIDKIGSIMPFFLSPHISVLPIFKHFLIELECWNSRCGLGPPFFMRLFSNFCNRVPLPPKESPPPKKKVIFLIYCVILMKFEIQHSNMFTNNNRDRKLWIEDPLPTPPGAPPPSFSKTTNSSFIVRYWLNFETQHIPMLTKNNWDRNVWMEAPLPPGGSSPSKRLILHLLSDFYQMWKIIF